MSLSVDFKQGHASTLSLYFQMGQDIYYAVANQKNILEGHINSQNAIISDHIKPKLEPITLPERKKIK